MWLWHALGETVHKAMSFDVWDTMMKPGRARYLVRVDGIAAANTERQVRAIAASGRFRAA